MRNARVKSLEGEGFSDRSTGKKKQRGFKRTPIDAKYAEVRNMTGSGEAEPKIIEFNPGNINAADLHSGAGGKGADSRKGKAKEVGKATEPKAPDLIQKEPRLEEADYLKLAEATTEALNRATDNALGDYREKKLYRSGPTPEAAARQPSKFQRTEERTNENEKDSEPNWKTGMIKESVSVFAADFFGEDNEYLKKILRRWPRGRSLTDEKIKVLAEKIASDRESITQETEKKVFQELSNPETGKKYYPNERNGLFFQDILDNRVFKEMRSAILELAGKYLNSKLPIGIPPEKTEVAGNNMGEVDTIIDQAAEELHLGGKDSAKKAGEERMQHILNQVAKSRQGEINEIFSGKGAQMEVSDDVISEESPSEITPEIEKVSDSEAEFSPEQMEELNDFCAAIKEEYDERFLGGNFRENTFLWEAQEAFRIIFQEDYIREGIFLEADEGAATKFVLEKVKEIIKT